MEEIRSDPSLELQVVATGMHMSTEFGLTYRAIEKDGFQISRKVDMLLASDSEQSIIKSVGTGLISFSDVFESMKPEIVVVLGDRFELLSVVIAAYLHRIPIAHIHGGETTEGAVDEAVRHSITKMASIHFAATEEYRKRIIQMGESPNRVFNFGAPGLDAIYKEELLGKSELQERLGFDMTGPVAIVTYHPVTLENSTAEIQIDNLLEAVKQSGIKGIFTKANADAQGRVINRKAQDFCETAPAQYKFFDSLGQLAYLSCLKHLDMMIGNSSSGLVEAPSFGLPVVNVGDRQRGRARAENVIDVDYSVGDIVEGIRQASSTDFKRGMKKVRNPYDRYGDGKTGYRIKETLKNTQLKDILMKKFHDINVEGPT